MPRVPECTDKNKSGWNAFKESLIAYVSGSEKGLGPDVVYLTSSYIFFQWAS